MASQRRPGTVRQAFHIVTRPLRWECDDVDRRLDQRTLPLAQPERAASPSREADAAIEPVGRRIPEPSTGLPVVEREVSEHVRCPGSMPETAEVLGASVRAVQPHLGRSVRVLAERLSARPSSSGRGRQAAAVP